MSNTKQSDTERGKLQGLWRAAALRTTPLEVPTPTLAVARNLRFALYNAVRAERNQPELADPELAQALDTISLSVEDNPPRLVLRRKALIDLLDGVLKAVPELAELSKTSLEVKADASLARVEALLAADAAAPAPIPHAADAFREPSPATREYGKAPNPFYTRNGTGPGSTS